MATADNSISLHPPPPMPVCFLSVFPQITKWHIQVILEVGLDGKTKRRKKPRRLQRRLKKRRWERWMTGDISGKRANQSLKEHLGGPKLTHTHTYTHKSCKEMDGIKRSHSEQHWIIKKAKGGKVAQVGRVKIQMLWKSFLLQDDKEQGRGGGITVKKLWVWCHEFCPSYLWIFVLFCCLSFKLSLSSF